MQWWPDGTAVFAVTDNGAGWQLDWFDRFDQTQEVPEDDGGGTKRLCMETTDSQLIRAVGNANRVQLTQLSTIKTMLCKPRVNCARVCRSVPCRLPFCVWAQSTTSGQPRRALHKLRCEGGGCALSVVSNGEALRASAAGEQILQPALFDALIGGKGVALLVSDAIGGIFAQLQQPASPASLLLQLGEPLAALLLAPHVVDAGCQPCAGGADTVVVVGRYGRVLLLSALEGGLCQRLWQLHTATRVIAACVVGRTLLYASLEGALAATLPVPLKATDAADDGVTRLQRRGVCQGWVRHEVWRSRKVSIPTMAADLLAFGSVPLCLQPLPRAPSDVSAPAATSAIALFSDGVLALLRPASASLDATGAATAVATDFVGEYSEQCVRRQLQLIRVDSELLAAGRATLKRADRTLVDLAKACHAMRMIHAGCGVYLIITFGAKAPRLQVQLRNTAELGSGWSLYAQLRHAPPLAMNQTAIISEGAATDVWTLASCCSWCNAPLQGLGDGGTLAMELPLVLPALHAQATLLFSLVFQSANIGTTACAFLCEQRIALHHLLRPLGSRPTATCLRLGLNGALVTLLSAPEIPKAVIGAINTFSTTGCGSSAPGREPVQCKLRLLSTSSLPKLRVVLDALLDGGAPGAGGSAYGGRQEVGSTQVILDLGWEVERAGGDTCRAWGLLVQANRPEAVWALRAALLQALLRRPVPQRAACSGRLPALPALLVQQLQPVEQVQRPQLEAARAKLGAALQEVGALQPFIRKQEQKMLEMHDTLYRLRQMSSLYQGGISFSGLSSEAMHTCHAAIEVHQVTRRHLGCVSLCV